MAWSPYEDMERRIVEARDQLQLAGKLPGEEELLARRCSFLTRFGPEVLARLDDDALLTVMGTRKNPRSLIDYLESEDHSGEEPVFGCLRPTSKFGLGVWMDPQKHCWCRLARPGEYIRDQTPSLRLSESEAVAVARGYREQLQRASEVLGSLPEVAGDLVYAQLQADLEAAAPDLASRPWAHKYLFVVLPDALDAVHDARWQRYLLIKCLELPPEGDTTALYTCAGRFSRMARELGMSVTHLCLALTSLFGKPHDHWLLETTEAEWCLMAEQGFIDQARPDLGDLAHQTQREAFDWTEAMTERLRVFYPFSDRAAVLPRLRWLARQAQCGDIVIVHQDRTVLGVVELTGPYRHEPQSDSAHRRYFKILRCGLDTSPPLEPREEGNYPVSADSRVALAVEVALAEERKGGGRA